MSAGSCWSAANLPRCDGAAGQLFSRLAQKYFENSKEDSELEQPGTMRDSDESSEDSQSSEAHAIKEGDIYRDQVQVKLLPRDVLPR